MIEESQKFGLKDRNGKVVATLFAVPDVKEGLFNEKEYTLEDVEIQIGEEKARITLGDLRTILFALSNPKEQKEMMPIAMVTQRRYQTMLGVKAQKDIKKGEVVNFKVDIPLPPIEKEIMMEATRQINKGLIRPIR